jgi:hypothetical protein
MDFIKSTVYFFLFSWQKSWSILFQIVNKHEKSIRNQINVNLSSKLDIFKNKFIQIIKLFYIFSNPAKDLYQRDFLTLFMLHLECLSFMSDKYYAIVLKN